MNVQSNRRRSSFSSETSSEQLQLDPGDFIEDNEPDVFTQATELEKKRSISSGSSDSTSDSSTSESEFYFNHPDPIKKAAIVKPAVARKPTFLKQSADVDKDESFDDSEDDTSQKELEKDDQVPKSVKLVQQAVAKTASYHRRAPAAEEIPKPVIKIKKMSRVHFNDQQIVINTVQQETMQREESTSSSDSSFTTSESSNASTRPQKSFDDGVLASMKLSYQAVYEDKAKHKSLDLY